jgi:hypothetical protein
MFQDKAEASICGPLIQAEGAGAMTGVVMEILLLAPVVSSSGEN